MLKKLLFKFRNLLQAVIARMTSITTVRSLSRRLTREIFRGLQAAM